MRPSPRPAKILQKCFSDVRSSFYCFMREENFFAPLAALTKGGPYTQEAADFVQSEVLILLILEQRTGGVSGHARSKLYLARY